MTLPIRRLSLVLLAVAAVALPASAGHHQWFISEIYSNDDGTIQFVELKGTANNEHGIGSFSIDTLGPEGSIPTSASLSPNLPSTATNGAYVLIGTAGYAAIASQQGAPAPDRLMSADFLELVADRVRYAGIASTDRVYTGGGLPTDGVLSLDYESGSPGTTANTPQNFAGETGTIDANQMAVPTSTRAGVLALLAGVVGVVAVALRRKGDGLIRAA